MLKKVAFYILIIVVILSVPVIFLIMKANMPDNIKSPLDKEFSINRIKYYSSANAISNTTSYQNPEWNIKIYQYTDVAVFLDRINEAKAENYITGLYLNFGSPIPENCDIYYLNPQNFGNSNLNEDNLIDTELKYTVINSSNDENTQNYNIPIFFQDCSNPITIRLVNKFPNSYRVSNDSDLIYNGSLLRNINVNLEELKNSFVFDLVIDTRNGPTRAIPIQLEIPFEDETRSIFDGDFEAEKKVNIEL